MKAVVAAILLWGCVLGCSQGGSKAHLISATGGTNSFHTLEQPTRVEAFLLKQRGDEGVPPFDPMKSGEYPVRTGPLVLPTALATNISAILCNPNTYKRPGSVVKACAPRFGVRLSFIGPAGSLDVLLCLECNILAFAPGGSVSDDKDFDPGRPQIVKFLKTAFPDDKTIQNLKEVLR